LPPLAKTALEMVNELRTIKAGAAERSGAALQEPVLAETRGTLA
jgi:hypothetical protein